MKKSKKILKKHLKQNLDLISVGMIELNKSLEKCIESGYQFLKDLDNKNANKRKK